jgi:hypothetical protein
LEETGSEPGRAEFVGVATIQLGHERRIELLAIYRAELAEVAAFEANDRADSLAWWDVVQEFADLSPIDAHLARVALGVA